MEREFWGQRQGRARAEREPSDYDDHQGHGQGYDSPQAAADAFARYVPLDSRVLDAGAGVGLTGEALYESGYREIVALDSSRGMLHEARKRKVYRELHQMFLDRELAFPSHSFDAVISVGALASGNVRPDSLDELVRVTRPGGYVVFTMRPDVCEKRGFRKKQEALACSGKWELVEAGGQGQAHRGRGREQEQVWVYRVRSETSSE